MSSRNGPLRRNHLSLFIQAGLASMLAIPMAQAATCTVNVAGDNPATASSTVTAATTSGTLRDCILAANLMTGASGVPTTPGMTIDLSAAAGSSVELLDDLPMLFNNITIDAGSGAQARINGKSKYRIFFVSGLPEVPGSGPADPDGSQATRVTLKNLELYQGHAEGGQGGGMGAGGALFVNKAASVTLDHVSFAFNRAAGGGGHPATNDNQGNGGGGMEIGRAHV